MSEVFFTADLHLGHKNVQKFRKRFENQQEHDQYMMEMCLSEGKKRNTLWILGDVLFDDLEDWRLYEICRAYGQVNITIGNHCTEGSRMDKLVEMHRIGVLKLHSLVKYKNFWLSHAPIHPDELRGKVNIHGHTHNHKIQDKRYVCACPEQNDWKLLNLNDIKRRV